MNQTVKYLLFLVITAYLFFISIFFFLKGFPLGKGVLVSKSRCEESSKCKFLPQEDFFFCSRAETLERLRNNLTTSTCFHTRTRVILLLIDALRSDFLHPKHNGSSYDNKFTIVHELLRKGNSSLLRYTGKMTSRQKILSLMSGSEPNFIDLGNNFSTMEDNLLDQMSRMGKRVVFLGNDIWARMFPRAFFRTFPFPSFNVRDVDGSDKGIIRHLAKEVRRDDWDLMIAHFTGIGNCGHSFGPYHPEMGRIMKQINGAVRDLVRAMDSKTILVIVGDQGMTETGKKKDMTAPLFVHSTQPLQNHIRDPNLVKLTDLTPTLSVLLGVPIPFSSLGQILFTFLPQVPAKNEAKYLSSLLLSNMAQVTWYAQALFGHTIEDVKGSFDGLRDGLALVNSTSELEILIRKSGLHVKNIRKSFGNQSIDYNGPLVSYGILTMVIILVLFFLIFDCVPVRYVDELITKNLILFLYIGLGTSCWCSYVLFFYKIIDDIFLWMFGLTGTFSFISLILVIFIKSELIATVPENIGTDRSGLNWVSRLFIFLNALSSLSNDYVIQECAAVSYLFTTMVCISSLSVKGETKKSREGIVVPIRLKAILMAMLLSTLIRLSWYFWICREEQTRKCFFSRLFTDSDLSLTKIFSFALFVTLTRYFLRSLGNLVGFSPSVIISKYSPVVCVICCGCFWMLQSRSAEAKTKLLPSSHVHMLGRMAFLTASISILIYFFRPTCVTYFSKNSFSPQLHSGTFASSVFHYLKAMLTPSSSKTSGYPIIYGLATAYSSSFVNLGVLLCLLSAVILGEERCLMAIILITSLTILCLLTAVVRNSKCVLRDDIFSVPWWTVYMWGLSSTFFFYGTGHQATFYEIHWDPGFMFGNTLMDFLPYFLVTLNTFSSQIIHSLLLPSLYILPFSLIVIWPATAAKGFSEKGELSLFERRHLARAGVFSLCIKFILFLGLRVVFSMAAACVHATHLMAWKIFIPKLLFECFGLLISLPCTVLGYLLFERISSSIGNLLTKIQKDSL